MPKEKTHYLGSHGFFPYPNAHQKAKQIREQRHELVVPPAPRPKQLVNVGEQGDCSALAAAMVDNIIANDRLVHAQPHQELARANQEFCSRLLQRHLAMKCFSHYNEVVGERLWTPVQRLERMRHKQGFIHDLGFTILQAAIGDISKNPENYRGAFMDYPMSTETGLSTLDTWIDKRIIAAVAFVFNVPVKVRETKPNHELYKLLHYGPDAKMSYILQAHQIDIRLEGKHYQPMLADPSAFATVASQSAFMHQEASADEFNYPNLEEMLARVKAADEKMLEEFNDNHANLTKLVKEAQLDKEQLLALKEQLLTIYIQGLNKQCNSDSLVERQGRQIGLEHGNQNFFERAIKNVGSDIPLTRSAPDDVFETSIVVDELIHAVARAMTINDLSPKDVYDQIEGKIESKIEGDRPSVSLR